MRIRKRQVPFPLSSLSPVPLSDPLLHDLNYSPPPVVQLHPHHRHDPPNPSHPVEKTVHVGHPPPQPSDQRVFPIGRAGKGSDVSGENKNKENKQDCGLEISILKGEEDERESRKGGDQKGNDDDDIREESILVAETLMGFASGSSSSSHPAAGSWFKGEKAFPLKKRRGSFERGANNIGQTIMDDQKDKKSMKTKTNKKREPRQQQNDDVHQKQDDHVIDGNRVTTSASATRKRARGGALMEGSRCSRVNGRGWRCCQQTLVGYSLCEHHLGKGRLRSMNSVRSRSTAAATATTTSSARIASTETEFKQLSASRILSVESSPPQKEDTKAVLLLDDGDIGEGKGNEGEDEEIKKPLLVTKKRMKLGIVKARSMSSLLGQTNSRAMADEDDDNNK
ncbi:hypothetical protein D8674_011260 [Pyrus ussuriensis x Pyrus communis]|uniref:WRC domain-containing protein n=1 Tax=Pyrus ussuriensis x Pyrus communis TaxID=2448454 RepID=A0A5N5G3U0_9ROSA|nr:hypothetical protein D8674_011260 [Pyrus ussuriensis x Pyrus communis]